MFDVQGPGFYQGYFKDKIADIGDGFVKRPRSRLANPEE